MHCDILNEGVDGFGGEHELVKRPTRNSTVDPVGGGDPDEVGVDDEVGA